MLPSRGVLALVVTGAALGCARPPPREPHPVHVHIETGPRPMRMALVPAEAETIPSGIVTCGGTCDSVVPTGRYTFHAEARWVSSLDRMVVITRPTRLRVHQGSALQRDLGLALGITSIIMSAVTGWGMWSCNAHEDRPGEHGGCNGWLLGLGLSLAAIPVGWMLYGGGKSELEVDPIRSTTAPLRIVATGDRAIVAWELRL